MVSKKIQNAVTARRKTLSERRQEINIWTKPVLVFQLFFKQMVEYSTDCYGVFKKSGNVQLLTTATVLTVAIVYNTENPVRPYLAPIENNLAYASFWLTLGFLSSCGLGTGLHTYVLFVGPYVARYARASFVCNSVHMYVPDNPWSYWSSWADYAPICPAHVQADTWGRNIISSSLLLPDSDQSATWLRVFISLQYETILWGLGTGFGEMPPYFIARSAKLSGTEDDVEEMADIAEIERGGDETDLFFRAKKGMHDLVQYFGFWGILAAASIPNPLFDLAGLTCGHFLIPFEIFFFATLIGKGLVKAPLQTAIVTAIAMETDYLETIIDSVLSTAQKYVLTPGMAAALMDKWEKAKYSLNNPEFVKSQQASNSYFSISGVFNAFILSFVGYFILKAIEGFALEYQKARDAESMHEYEKALTDGVINPDGSVKRTKSPTPTRKASAKTSAKSPAKKTSAKKPTKKTSAKSPARGGHSKSPASASPTRSTRRIAKGANGVY
eukprot:Clim_evm41s153 gene=Clim_evmTU41s153